MRNRILFLIVPAALLVQACLPEPPWIEFAYFCSFDPISSTHVSAKLAQVGVKWRVGREGWRGFHIEVSADDRTRALKALIDDQLLGNIDCLVGYDKLEPVEKAPNVRFIEFMKSQGLEKDAIERKLFESPEVSVALAEFPFLIKYSARRRSYVDEKGTQRRGLDGRMELSMTEDRKVAGKTIIFYLWQDGAEERLSGGEWWAGDEQTVEELRRRGKQRPK